MMDHVPTLCAIIGTLGAAATGLALMFPDENSAIFSKQLSDIVNRPTRSYSTPVQPPWTLSYITSMTDSTKSSRPAPPLAVRSSDSHIRHEKSQIPVRRKTLSHTPSRKTSLKSRPAPPQAVVGNTQSSENKPEAVVKSIELLDQPLDQAGRLNDSPLFLEPAPKVVAPLRLDMAPPAIEKTDFAHKSAPRTPVTAVQTTSPFPLREESHVITRPVLLDSLVNDDDDDTIQSWGFAHVFPHLHTTNSSRESSAPAAIGLQQERVAHDGRGARSMGRRIGSNMHLRSQSVPVVRDPNSETDPPRPTTSAKFATWGLGTKGASEDWNDDFDFDEEEEDQEEIMSPFTFDANPLCSPMSPFMRKVPQSIMERQASVQGQFGQVQELTLLVDELKRLRAQAGILDLMQGKDEELWTEAEGIINLATLDNYDDDLAPPKSPSTPGFDFDAFEENHHPPALGHRKSSGFLKLAEQEIFTVEFPKFDMDFRSSPNAKSTKQDPSTPPRTPTTRARANSSARVKSVLETIYQQRSDKKEVRFTAHHKLPFDTNQLRELVARAKIVTKSLRDMVCKAEVLCSPVRDSPLRAQSDPPFSQIFSNPQETTLSNGRPALPKSRSVNGYVTNNNGGNDTDLAGRMTLMTVI